jgi:hypothetical protein
MAKKANRPQPVVDVTPGADPHIGNPMLSRRMGTVLGCACMVVFILFKELWIGTLACALGFAIIFGLQLIYDKSKPWYTSWNLYAAGICLVLAYLEYSSGLISEFMKIG